MGQTYFDVPNMAAGVSPVSVAEPVDEPESQTWRRPITQITQLLCLFLHFYYETPVLAILTLNYFFGYLLLWIFLQYLLFLTCFTPITKLIFGLF
jgi:hypothetical protein